MKRIIFFALLLTFAATGTFAQEIQLPYPSTTALSYEKSKIYYEGERISQRECQTFLKLNAQEDIYRKYRNGRRMYTAGWSLMGIGLATDAAALGLITAVAIEYSIHPPACGCGFGMAVLFSGMMMGGALLFEIPAIPLLCVGKCHMRKSIDTYNISLSEPQTAQNYWSIQPTNNGIGLAFHF